MRIMLACLLSLAFLGLGVTRIINEVQFGISVTDYLKRAADANTVELAVENLDTAITELERRGVTSGNTGVLWQSPANDVSFFYANLTSARAELEALTPETTPLERSNMLMKLRESIADHGEGGTTITGPGGLAVHPNNPFWFWSLWITALFAIGAWCTLLQD